MKKAIFKLLPAASIFLLASCGANKEGDTPTEPRICELNAITKLHVRDFGAGPTSENIFQALEDAMAAAKAADGPVEILFEPDAVYRITLPNAAELKETGTCFADQYAWHIKNATNLVINGQGATLLVTDAEIGGICMEDSFQIELKNFEIDYDPLPYAQGTIATVNLEEYWFELKLDDGFPEPDMPNFKRAGNAHGNWGLTIRDEPGGRRRYGPIPVFAESWEKTGEHLWRFHPPEIGEGHNVQNTPLEASGLKPGDRYVHMARNWSQAIAGINCDRVLWEGITIHAAPGLAFYPRGTSHHTIRDCHIKLKEGRIFSTTSDGIHMRGSRGHMLVEDCSFEGMGDDGINVHSSALSVVETPAPNQIVVRKHTFSVRPGDELVQVRSDSATILGKAKVKEVQDQGGTWLITLDRGLPDVAAGEGFNSSDNFYNLSEAATPFVIRNCHFKDYRGRGILISAHGGVIENNLFEMPEGWGVVLLYESVRWAEGPMANNLLIRNNEFRATAKQHHSAICSHIITRGGATVVTRPFRDILIENNRFYDYAKPVVELEAVNGITLRNNQVFTPADVSLKYTPVILENCENVATDKLEVNNL